MGLPLHVWLAGEATPLKPGHEGAATFTKVKHNKLYIRQIKRGQMHHIHPSFR